MNVICFGDSNTWGYDPRGYFGGRYDHPWPEILAGKTGWNVSNRGENGREIPGRSANFPPEADLVIIMLGTNDLLQGASAEMVCRRMERFLDAADRARVLLVAPPPMQPGAWVGQRQLIADSAALGTHYKDLAMRLGIRFFDAGVWRIPLAYDGVHFTGEGHAAFAEGLYRELRHI